MGRRRWLLSISCWILICWFMFAPPHVQAADCAQYRMLIAEGMREYRLHNFVEARSLLSRAQVLFPNARALHALGLTELALRHYRESAAALSAALASEERPLDPREREQTVQLLAQLENFLTRVTVFGRPWPSVARVDGVEVPLRPGAELVLEIGDHVLEFARPGHFSERQLLRAVGGESVTIRVSLLPITIGPFAAPQRIEL